MQMLDVSRLTEKLPAQECDSPWIQARTGFDAADSINKQV